MTFNSENFKKEVEDFSGVVLVDFFAPWCGPCQIMGPVVEEMVKENKEIKVKIGKLNVDENQDIAMKYGVMSIPTFILFKNGKAVDQKMGYGDKQELLKMIDDNKLV